MTYITYIMIWKPAILGLAFDVMQVEGVKDLPKFFGGVLIQRVQNTVMTYKGFELSAEWHTLHPVYHVTVEHQIRIKDTSLVKMSEITTYPP